MMPKESSAPVCLKQEEEADAGCICPNGCLVGNMKERGDDGKEMKWVEVACSVGMCLEDPRIHPSCFDKWLSELLRHLDRDRHLHTRNYTVDRGKYMERLVWTTNVYRHVFQFCKCPCGGHLKLAEKQSMRPEEAVVPKQKAKRLPGLNQSATGLLSKFTPLPTYAGSRKSNWGGKETSSLYAPVQKGVVPVGMSVAAPAPKKPKNRKGKTKAGNKAESEKEEREIEDDDNDDEWLQITKRGRKVVLPKDEGSLGLSTFSNSKQGFQALPRESLSTSLSSEPTSLPQEESPGPGGDGTVLSEVVSHGGEGDAPPARSHHAHHPAPMLNIVESEAVNGEDAENVFLDLPREEEPVPERGHLQRLLLSHRQRKVDPRPPKFPVREGPEERLRRLILDDEEDSVSSQYYASSIEWAKLAAYCTAHPHTDLNTQR